MFQSVWDRTRRRGLRRAHDERGFTLIELLIAASMALVLLAAVLQLLVIAGDKASAVDARRGNTEDARTTLDRLVRELRQSTTVTWTSSTSVTYKMTVASGTATVTVSCSASRCLRSDGTTNLSLTGATNTDVFCVAGQNCNDCAGQTVTTPNYVVVRITHGATTLCDGANLRGATLGT